MLEVIAYFVLPAVVALVILYIYVEIQRKKIITENKKAVFFRVTKIKDNFKAALKKLVEQQLLTIEGHNAIYKIANNFFVFQSVTNANIAYCEQLLNGVIAAMPITPSDSDHFDTAQEQVRLFAVSLPVAANGYNANFYRTVLPELIQKLIDSQNNLLAIELEIEEKQQVPESETAA